MGIERGTEESIAPSLVFLLTLGIQLVVFASWGLWLSPYWTLHVPLPLQLQPLDPKSGLVSAAVLSRDKLRMCLYVKAVDIEL